MSGYPIVKALLQEHNGVTYYNGNPEKHKYYALLRIKGSYFVVVFPEGKKSGTEIKQQLFHGTLWKIGVEDGKPILTGEGFHVMNERAISVKMAIRKFNTRYVSDINEQGEIMELMEF